MRYYSLAVYRPAQTVLTLNLALASSCAAATLSAMTSSVVSSLGRITTFLVSTDDFGTRNSGTGFGDASIDGFGVGCRYAWDSSELGREFLGPDGRSDSSARGASDTARQSTSEGSSARWAYEVIKARMA